MGWFGRGKKDDRSVEALLAESNAASPTGTPAATDGSGLPGPPAVGDAGLRLPVEDVFSITGRGTVVTGRIESGIATVGQQVTVVRDGGVALTTRITGIEMFRKVLDTAKAGDNVGLLLADVTKDQLHAGDVVSG